MIIRIVDTRYQIFASPVGGLSTYMRSLPHYRTLYDRQNLSTAQSTYVFWEVTMTVYYHIKL